MAYRATPKQLSLDSEIVQRAEGAPPAVPKLTAGAPKYVNPTQPSFSQQGQLLRRENELLRGLNLNVEMKPPAGTGGPERWDRLRRDTFSGTNLQYVAATVPNPVTATDIMGQHPEMVASFRNKLEARRSKLTEQQIASSPFWREYDTLGQGFVAQFLADLQGLLTRQERFEQGEGNLLQLSPAQQRWVRVHPLGIWLDWL